MAYALPGLKVAPTRKKGKPPCKYGPRGADGYCPKRPKAAKSTRAKPPCKYGPRTASGKCPKKPKSFVTAAKGDLKAGRNPLASGSSARTAAETAAQAAAARSVEKVARKLESRTKAALKKVGPTVGLALRQALTAVGAMIAASAWMESDFNKRRLAELKKVEEQYRYTLAVIPPAKQVATNSNYVGLNRWLGQEIEKINQKYAKELPFTER